MNCIFQTEEVDYQAEFNIQLKKELLVMLNAKEID
jgi:hypothetical protein